MPPVRDDDNDHEFSNLRVIGDRLRANAQIEETETRPCGGRAGLQRAARRFVVNGRNVDGFLLPLAPVEK